MREVARKDKDAPFTALLFHVDLNRFRRPGVSHTVGRIAELTIRRPISPTRPVGIAPSSAPSGDCATDRRREPWLALGVPWRTTGRLAAWHLTESLLRIGPADVLQSEPVAAA